MKKYLMRGGMSPLDNMSAEMVLQNNSIGGNTGNLLYAYSVFRNIVNENVRIDIDYYGMERFYTDEDIERINQEYDAYICPLADAFRDSFIPQLEKFTALFKKLKIPCYIVGVGLRTPYEPDIKSPHKFDHAAKALLKTVLDKSAVIGVRGEITGEYLKSLGFREEQEYTVIGCPSLYAMGRHLPARDLTLSSHSKICFNMSNSTPHSVMAFLFREMESYSNHFVVAQNIRELRLLYDGTEYEPHPFMSALLPRSCDHPLVQEDRYHVFYNIPTWLEFLRTMDLSVGARLHGNVAAILAGCPALVIMLDGRMRELAAYHHLPSVSAEKIRESDSLKDMIDQIDLKSHLKHAAPNFDRFISFLDRNQISHNYTRDINRRNVFLDEKMSGIQYQQISAYN